MSTESTMERLRRANPVRQVVSGHDADLFARITMLPGDASLEAPHRRRPLLRRRGVVLVLAAALAALLASTAFAVSNWLADDVVPPPVTRQEYLDAQRQLTLPPGVTWPDVHTPADSVTTRGGGGGRAVMIAQNAWECSWVEAIRTGDATAARLARGELETLLARHVVVAPAGAPEGWTPTPAPTVPFAVFANDGGVEWIRAAYRQAAAGDARNLAQSCRANAPR